MLDTTTGRKTRAAIAVGNPDKADHVSVTTPGRTTTTGSLPGMVKEANNLQYEAEKQLRLQGKNDTVASIAWLGYDTPQNPKAITVGELAEAGVDTGTADRAAEGAKALNQFYNGLEASHDGGKAPHITAVGHSYGSLTTGLALQNGEHPVTDMVVYGSPGVGANSPTELGLDNGHAYVMRADDDLIRWAQDVPKILDWNGVAHPLVEDWQDNNNGGFGSDPARNPNFTQLETHDSTSTDGQHRRLPGAHGHSDYPRSAGGTDADPLPRVTTYNVAAVVAGLPENAIQVRR
ncbi:alpha/beta hydrolase [Nocardia camponoti]